MKNKRNLNREIKVGIVTDQLSVSTGYALLLNNLKNIRVVLQARNGKHLLDTLKTIKELPDILLMDAHTKARNGIRTTKNISKLYPRIKIIALVEMDEGKIIRQMIDAGACAYLSKAIPMEKMEQAIRQVHTEGKYSANLFHLYSGEFIQFDREVKEISLTEREKEFLRLLCKGNTYIQIAADLDVTVKGIDYYFSCVSKKLNTKNNIIMAFEALRLGIINALEKTETSIK